MIDHASLIRQRVVILAFKAFKKETLKVSYP